MTKVVVRDQTAVKVADDATRVVRITVGTPINIGDVAQGSLTGLDDVNNSVNRAHGTILQFDSASNKFIHTTLDSAIGSNLSVIDNGGFGSLTYDSATATITYAGIDSSTITGLFSATSSNLGSVSINNGIITYVGPTQSQIRSAFQASGNLTYDSASGLFSVSIPSTSATFDSDFAAKTTDNLTEGSSNLYYTDSRGRAALSVNDAGGFGSLSYDSPTGVFSYNGPTTSDIRNQLVAGTNITYDSATGVISSTGIQASDVRNQLVAGPGISYDSATGVITNTATDTTRSDSSIRALITASGSIQYDSVSGNISFSERSDASIRQLFASTGGALTYDTGTGLFSVDLTNATTIDDSSLVKSIFSVNNSGSGEGSLAYNSTSGQFTFTPVTDSAIKSKFSAVDAGGFGSFGYDSTSGAFTYTGIDSAAIRGVFSAGGSLSFNDATGEFSFTETTNFDSATAKSLFSVNHTGFGGLSYDASTGVFTHTSATDSNFRRALFVSDSGETGSLTYDSVSGVFNYAGPSRDSIRSLFSAGESDGSLGQLRYDSSTGNVTFALSPDSVRGSFSVVNTHVFDSFHGISYDSATGVISYKGPAPSNFRGMLSVDSTIDQSLGFGRFNYFAGDSAGYGGKFRYFAPTIDSIRGGFFGGNGIKYDSTDGVIAMDSNAIFSTGGISIVNNFTVGGTSQFFDSAKFQNKVTFFDSTVFIGDIHTNRITNNVDSGDSNITLDPKNDAGRGGTVRVMGGLLVFGDSSSQAYFDTNSFATTAKLLSFSSGNNDSASVDNSAITFGGLSDPVFLAYDADTNKFLLNRGANINGEITGPTITRIDTAIDALPDSAQVRGLISTDGNGLSYNSTTGVLSFDSSADVTVNTLRGPANFIIDPAAVGDNTGSVQILGNLQVEGTTTTINSTTVSINDKNLVLADSAANPAAADSSGLYIGGAAATFLYKAADDRWVANKPLQTNQVYADSFYGTISSIANFSTDSLSEGPTNLYFTETRARNSLVGGAGITYNSGTGQFLIPSSGVTSGIYGTSTTVPQVTVDSLGFVDSVGLIPISTVNNIYFDSTNGIFHITTATETFSTPLSIDPYTTDSLAEGSTNLYFTEARARASLKVGTPQLIYDSATGTLAYDQGNTDSVAEGSTNLYFTEARARASLKVGGQLTYDSALGTLTFGGANIKGLFASLSDDSFGDVRWDDNYGFRLDSDAIMDKTIIIGDSINTGNDFALMYSSTRSDLRRVSLSQLGNKIGGGGGGSSLFGFINL
jgi:hypothetical protein